MEDTTVADPPNGDVSDFDSLPIPPLDPAFFSQNLYHDQNNPNNFLSFDENDVVDGFDFDFSFDDLYLPSDTNGFLNPGSIDPPGLDPIKIDSEFDYGSCDHRVSERELRRISGDHNSGVTKLSNSSSPELRQISSDQSYNAAGDSNENLSESRDRGSRVLNSASPELRLTSDDHSLDVSGYLNPPLSDSGESNHECSQESGNKGSTTCHRQVSGPTSSQSSGNCGSNVSEALNYPSPDSGNYVQSAKFLPDFVTNSTEGVVDREIKVEESGSKNYLLKRKKDNDNLYSEPRTSKYQKSNNVESPINEEDEKRKARLMRNRESAHLSRQRKKHYVEELEDKVRAMHSTIQDLNAKISYMMSENASLKQQMGGHGMCPPPQMPPPGVAMYPHPLMGSTAYPWMPCPPYVVKPQGSQVPLVPIPRLKPQPAKKKENKKSEGKTKKVASVSFLGLLCFILLFGALVPMVNVRYGGMREAFTGGSDYVGNKFYAQHHGRVLTVSGHLNGTEHSMGIGLTNGKLSPHCRRGNGGGVEANAEQKGGGSHPLPHSDEFVHSGNGSEPLIASLYVPRNDKLVKIDGNLIIHSVMASEKAMASREDPRGKSGSETGLAVPANLAIPLSGVERNNGRHPHLYRSPTEGHRALASGSADRDNLKSTAADGKLQQWFREGLAGPLLSSGMCTEVFQFDVSPASGAIVPATSVTNVSAEHKQNSTHMNKGRNRRILKGLPIPLAGSSRNITKEHMHKNPEKENFHGNNSLSSMVVSVLVDPRESGDSDGEGMMGPKSLSRIFVVVLIDSVKYVTYSCMLPLMGSGPHLVTT
ncbi:unnamed protein product [Ilex paraguariensis]|uniref:BZIP domain-containing protein n=1 Tax=Ilex paraguariensis TaxID=185542 RepID=A0ABC8V5E2_9AQUA